MTAPRALVAAAELWLEERERIGGTSAEFAADRGIDERLASAALSALGKTGRAVWRPAPGGGRRYFALAFKPAILAGALAPKPKRNRSAPLRLDPAAPAFEPPGVKRTVWAPPARTEARQHAQPGPFAGLRIGQYLPGDGS